MRLGVALVSSQTSERFEGSPSLLADGLDVCPALACEILLADDQPELGIRVTGRFPEHLQGSPSGFGITEIEHCALG